MLGISLMSLDAWYAYNQWQFKNLASSYAVLNNDCFHMHLLIILY